ncbi:MNIO family bufferin maturase [Nitrospira sp. M1]
MNESLSQPATLAQPNVGLGLRPVHYPHLETRPHTSVTWFEAISENYMDTEGRPLNMLQLIREDYPVALHGVSLSIASTEGLRPEYVKQLKRLKDRIEPWIVSDHLCWTGLQASNFHDLLPFPYTDEALTLLLKHVDQVQNALGCHMLLENVSTYLQPPGATYAEWEFLTTLAKQSGCKLLLDVNNLYVNAINHRFDPEVFLQAIPTELIGQIHLAGYTDMGTYLFDTHSKPVYPEVWELFSKLIARAPDIPVLIEWDDDIPEFSVLEQEAHKATRIWNYHHGHTHAESVSTSIFAHSL